MKLKVYFVTVSVGQISSKTEDAFDVSSMMVDWDLDRHNIDKDRIKREGLFPSIKRGSFYAPHFNLSVTKHAKQTSYSSDLKTEQC